MELPKKLMPSCVLLVALAVSGQCIDDPSLPPGLLYPFGTDVGDLAVSDLPDGHVQVDISRSFPFYKTQFQRVFVS